MRFTNDNLNLLLVEDDLLQQERLIKQLAGIGIGNILTANDGVTARKNVLNANIHLAILDLDLGEEEFEGIELGREFCTEYKIPVLFLSNDINHQILRGSQYLPDSEYLLKGASTKQIQISVQWLLLKHLLTSKSIGRPNLSLTDNNFFLVKSSKGHLERIDKECLLYLEASNGGTIFYTRKKKCFAYLSLQAAISKLASVHLIRIHKKFAIALNAIQTTSEEIIGLNNGTQLPIGRLFRKNVKAMVEALRIH